MQAAQLPYIDEHTIDVAADADELWPVLLEALDRTFSRPAMARFARIVGCADSAATGPRPLTEGSTVPGFRVVVAVPGCELALQGRHRFSSYALTYRLERVTSGRSRLRAESRAAFPGLAGGFYRMLIIGTGGHVVAVGHSLSVIRRSYERSVQTRI
jgi:hypothetical protein